MLRDRVVWASEPRARDGIGCVRLRSRRLQPLASRGPASRSKALIRAEPNDAVRPPLPQEAERHADEPGGEPVPRVEARRRRFGTGRVACGGFGMWMNRTGTGAASARK